MSLRFYYKYYEDISNDELWEGMLGHGMFNSKIPPAFRSKPFFDYVKSESKTFKKKGYDYARYENIRNINIPRILAIPHPFAYANLIHSLVDSWDEIKTKIKSNTLNQAHKISKVHIRKMNNKPHLFEMNYKTFEDEPNQDIDHIHEARYLIKADISNCFPSIYSHAVPWALIGKKIAKREMKDSSKWQNKIDFNLRNTKNQETNGILIGPHSSNLISEIILTRIDKTLYKKKYRFTRHIDDYTCYTKDMNKAEQFLLDLATELKEYELTLNHKKSEIKQLPHYFIETWVRRLKNHRFNYYLKEGGKLLPLKEVEIYLDLATELMKEFNENSAILNYALKVLAKKKLDNWAIEYLLKRVQHFCYIYPYLIQSIDDDVLIPFDISKTKIERIARSFYKLGIERKKWEACSYAVYFSLKYDFELDELEIKKEAIKSADCVFMTLAFLHEKKFGNCLFRFKSKAIRLLHLDFEKYWLFVYEVLPVIFFKDELKAMKRRSITFIREDL